MTPETEKALCESIAHWERMRDGTQATGDEPCSDDCALCSIFLDQEEICAGCPVALQTHKRGCSGTPYGNAYDAFGEFGIDSPEFRTAAQAEIDFLKSLLPVCQTCNGHGIVSGFRTGAVPDAEPCPDCATAPAGEA